LLFEDKNSSCQLARLFKSSRQVRRQQGTTNSCSQWACCIHVQASLNVYGWSLQLRMLAQAQQDGAFDRRIMQTCLHLQILLYLRLPLLRALPPTGLSQGDSKAACGCCARGKSRIEACPWVGGSGGPGQTWAGGPQRHRTAPIVTNALVHPCSGWLRLSCRKCDFLATHTTPPERAASRKLHSSVHGSPALTCSRTQSLCDVCFQFVWRARRGAGAEGRGQPRGGRARQVRARKAGERACDDSQRHFHAVGAAVVIIGPPICCLRPAVRARLLRCCRCTPTSCPRHTPHAPPAPRARAAAAPRGREQDQARRGGEGGV
jgi:hypothetical protein